MKRISFVLFCFALLGPTAPAFATEDSERILSEEDDLSVPAPASGKSLPASERYQRAEAVLDHFLSPQENPNASALDSFSNLQTSAGAKNLLRWLDPKNQFSRFYSADSNGMDAFFDRDSRSVKDYSVGLAESGRARSDGLLEKFRSAARNNPRNLPLQGLKIALDPGHMGSNTWDERTGKFVKDGKGNKISEGVINLQTALLLEKEFERLGASVFITHRTLAPVSNLSYDQLSLQELGRKELRSESLSPWFENLIAQNAPGKALYDSFSKNSAFKKLFSEIKRGEYFISRVDLAARADAIAAFDPDITLIIHYDASGPNTVSPTPARGTKVYVVGAFDTTEWATQKTRLRMAKHLLHPEAWSSSLQLGRKIVRRLQSDLGLTFDKGGGGTSLEVESGVFARNLAVSSSLSAHAVSYLEIMHYDDPTEFQRLRNYKHNMTINGDNYPYSDRLVEIVNSVRSGVLDFVASYSQGK